jgi:hypothetical protein
MNDTNLTGQGQRFDAKCFYVHLVTTFCVMTNSVKCCRSLKFKLDNQFSPVDTTERDTYGI